MIKLIQLLLVTVAIVFIISCSSDNDNNVSNTDNTPTGNSLSLTILHVNDHHSHLEEEDTDLEINGQEVEVILGGFPRVVALFNELSASYDNVLKLHAGDAITGTLYYTLFKGEADAALMNHVCFDAFILGNHEFDDGDAGLKSFLDDLSTPVCQTPVLAANVIPEVGTPLAPMTTTDYIQPYVIKEFNGEKVGIIGIDIAGKTQNSSSPLASTQFLDETTTSQQYIDELQAQGVNKIILMTHYQYANDITLAQNLSGVDVIVGGDSHTLLGDFEGYGLNPQGSYPTMETDLEGNTVCIVQAWQYSHVLGELHVEFDAEGYVTSCQGSAHLLIGDTFIVEDAELEGDDLQAVLDVVNADPQLTIVTPDAGAQATLDLYAEQVEVLSNEVIGTATEDLCLERIPGQGYSSLCDTSETSAQGSDISNLVALAFKTMSLTSDIAIQNAGGVRIDVPAGDITIETAYTLLPFANTLVELDITGAEIVQVLEDALDYALSEGGSTGAYPYASGLRYDVNISETFGNRFSNVEVKLKDETEWHAIDLTATYKIVTNDYIAGGRDGYATFADVVADGRMVDTYLDYAQSFVDYVKAVGSVSKLPYDDYSTQHFYDADGNLQQ